MPQSIPRGLGREHVLRALADLDAGIEHSFGAPTGYELVHEEKRYPPKAVIGLAFRHLTGQPSEEIEDTSERGRPWSREEVDLIVADYFTMLRAELCRIRRPK